MSFPKTAFVVVATLAIMLGACNRKDAATTAAAKNETLATVNGVAIPKSRVDLIIQQGHQRDDTPEGRKAVLDQLIMQTLVAEEATRKGLDKTAEVVEQVDMLKQSVLANAYVQDYMKNHPASDAELQAEYDKAKAAMSGTEYQARHILVASEAEAKAIIAQVKKDPKAFETLAQQKSLDPGSKSKGGELGWFEASRMVPEFGNAVAKLGKGQLSEPVKTQYGYHVILLEDSRAIQPPPFNEVRPQLAQQAQGQKLQKQLDELKAKAKIDITAAPAPAPAPAAEKK